MKVLLVQPTFGERLWFGKPMTMRPVDEWPLPLQLLTLFYYRAQPIGLGMIAGCVPPHHEVRILDMRAQPDDVLEQEIASFQPDVVGVSCMFTCAVNNTLRTVRRIRAARPGAFIVVGGHAPSLAPEQMDIDEVEAIAIGEGEVIFPPLLERLEQGRDWHDVPGLAYRARGRLHYPLSGAMLVDDLETLPLASSQPISLYAEKDQVLPWRVDAISTSRGCPFRCTFCAIQKMYQGRYRCVSAERAVREIEASPAELVGYFDDNFLINIPRARRIAELLLQRGIKKKHFFQVRSDSIARNPDLVALWKEAGLSDVFIGLESADDSRLKRMRKENVTSYARQAVEILHRHDIRILGSFIVEPDFDEQDFAKLRSFVREMEIDLPRFSILTPFPGTEVWDQLYPQLTTHNWDYFDTNHVVLPTRLPLPRFYRLCFELGFDSLMEGLKVGGSRAGDEPGIDLGEGAR